MEQLAGFLEQVESGVTRTRADYVRVETSVHPGQTLARYLNQRRVRRHRK